MKIEQTNIAFRSQHQQREQVVKRERLTYWKDGEETVTLNASQTGKSLKKMATQIARQGVQEDQLNVSSGVRDLQPQKRIQPLQSRGDDEIGEQTGDLQMMLLKQLIEHFTGRQIHIMRPQDLQAKQEQPSAQPPAAGEADAEGGQETLGWGMVYDHYEARQEYEQTSMSAQGQVVTADGQTIQVSLQLNMSRQFLEEKQLSLRAGDALKDPLVVNFAGNAVELTERNFQFDLDADGKKDQIAFVRSGSGFLGLDKNQDGQINDGSELFGALTGNGFAELARYDQDGNGWIDEADDIYQKLRIWTMDEQGRSRLFALGDKQIGAIYLGQSATPFQLKNDQNETLGQVRSTGLFLDEQGRQGTVQQIDLVV